MGGASQDVRDPIEAWGLTGALMVRLAMLGPCILSCVINARETMNVGLGRTSLVVAASDGPGG